MPFVVINLLLSQAANIHKTNCIISCRVHAVMVIIYKKRCKCMCLIKNVLGKKGAMRMSHYNIIKCDDFHHIVLWIHGMFDLSRA